MISKTQRKGTQRNLRNWIKLELRILCLTNTIMSKKSALEGRKALTVHTTHKVLCSTTHKEQLHTKAKGALSPEVQAKDLTEHILEGSSARPVRGSHCSAVAAGEVALDAKGPLQSWIKMTDAAVPGRLKTRRPEGLAVQLPLLGFSAGRMVSRC